MDVCDPDAKTENIRKLIKLHTGRTVDVSRDRICDIMRDAKQGNLPLPPLVLTKDKKYLLDSKSPLTQNDYETLYKSTLSSRDVKRIAKKVGLLNVDRTISELKNAIGRKLSSVTVREPILLPGSRVKREKVINNAFNNVRNDENIRNNNGNRNNENRNNVNRNNENRNNENRNNGNRNNENRNSRNRPNINSARRTTNVSGTIRSRHADRLKRFGNATQNRNRGRVGDKDPGRNNRRPEDRPKRRGFFGKLFGGNTNTSTNKLNTQMKIAEIKRNTQRQVSHQRAIQSRLRLREAKLAKNAISEAERDKRKATNEVTKIQNNKHLLEVELNKRASNSRKKANEAARARRELAKEKLHTGEMNMRTANLRRRLRTRVTSLNNAVRNRDKLKKELNEMKAGGDPAKIKEIQRKISVVDGKIKAQEKIKAAAQTAITSMAKRIRNDAQRNVDSLEKKIKTKELSKLSRETAKLKNFPDQGLLNELIKKRDGDPTATNAGMRMGARKRLEEIKGFTNDRGLLNNANVGSPEFRKKKDAEIANAERTEAGLHTERKKLEKELAAVKTAFSGQFSNGNRKNLQNRINTANKKIKNLEEELRKKPNTPTPTPSPNKPNTPTPTPSPNKPNTPTPSPSPTNNNRIRKLEELMKLRSNLHVQVARGRLSNSEEMSFKTRINQMKNASQKTNIEEDIKRATTVAKNARTAKRALNIQTTETRAREEAERKAKINIQKSKATAVKEAAAEAQRRRNEKRKEKFKGLLTQFNKYINLTQKSAFQQRFTNAQKAREPPNANRTNNQKGIIIRGGLAQIASELHKIKANKNEAAHKAAITRAKAAGSANEVAKQKDVYTQKRQASFNKMIRNAKNRHPVGTNQRVRMETLITNLTTKFNSGQQQRTINGQQSQTIINAGKIPELAKKIRELEKDFNNKQRAKNAQNIANANAKATKAQENASKAASNRNAAQTESAKLKIESNKAEEKITSLYEQRKAVVKMRNQAKKELEEAKEKSETERANAKVKLAEAQKKANNARKEIENSKNAARLVNKKKELVTLATKERVLQNGAPNGINGGGIGPKRPFKIIINSLRVNDLANGGMASKLSNQIQSAGKAKRLNKQQKVKDEEAAAEKKRAAKRVAALKKRQEQEEARGKRNDERKAAVANAEKEQKNMNARMKNTRNNVERRQKEKAAANVVNKMKDAAKKRALLEAAKKMKAAANKAVANKAAANKAAKIKKECESNPYLDQCEGALAARKKAGEKKAYKQKLTKILNTYNNRLGSLVDAKGNPSWPVKKNELFKKYANTITNDTTLRIFRAELNSVAKIHMENTRRIALEKKQAAAKQRREMQEQGQGKRKAERTAAEENAKKEKENMKARMKATRNKLAMNKAANKAAANKKVVSNLVGTAIKKANNKATNELVKTRLAYRTNVLVATREGRLPQNQEKYWYQQANTAMTMNMIQGVDKMFKIHLEKLKREKNAATKIQAAVKGTQVRKSVGGSSMGQDILKKHISGINVMAGQTIPGFTGKRLEDGGYESGWLNRVDKEGDTAVKRAKLRKMFDDKFELKKTLLKHENTNVRTGYGLGQLQSLKRQVMRPFSKKKYDSTKGTNKNEAILNAARIKKQIEEATNTHAKRILKQQPINMKKAGQKFKTYNNPVSNNTKMPKKTTSNPLFKTSGGFNGGIRLGEGRNNAINGSNVNITLKKAKPAQGPTVMKLGVQAAVAKNKLGNPMTNVERRVAARKAAEATGRLGGRMAQQRNNTFRTKGMTAGAIAKAKVNRAKKAEKIAAKRAAKKAK